MSDAWESSGSNRIALLGLLEVAVPAWAEKLRALSWVEVAVRSRICGQHVAEHGDIILFKGKKGSTAEAFNRLAEGLACLSFARGGVTFCGLSFDFEHPEAPK